GRHDLQLSNEFGRDTNPQTRWQRARKAREEGRALVLDDSHETLLYSRECKSMVIKPEERAAKGFEYFLLTREHEGIGGLKVAGEYQLVDVGGGQDERLRPSVKFRFNAAAGDQFHAITTENRPEKTGGETFFRHLAIVLDGLVVSAPT